MSDTKATPSAPAAPRLREKGRLMSASEIERTLVRLAHGVACDRAATSDAAILYERFEAVYAAHSRDEAELFEELEGRLTEDQQRELADFLRGLA